MDEDDDDIIRDDEAEGDGDEYGTLGGNGGELDICLTNTPAAAPDSFNNTAVGSGTNDGGNSVVFNDPIKVYATSLNSNPH